MNVAACTYPGASTECAPAKCQGDFEVGKSSCNGMGTCVAPAPITCGGKGCANAACTGGIPLGSIEEKFGGGEFTTSTQAPSGAVFNYGFECPGSVLVYVFDRVTIPTTGIAVNLAAADDPDYAAVVAAVKSAPPTGCGAFRVSTGFHPAPPFRDHGANFDSMRIPVPPGAQVNFLRLEVPPFTISSSPSGPEILWEIPLTPFKLTAFGR
jgi:hypothetical protein